MSSPNKPLLLKELDIPGRSKDPVSTDPDVWGINIAAALDNFPLHGLLCQAGPWGNMAEGDRLTIFWGTGQNVWVETVNKDEVNTQLRMFVASRHMVDGEFAASYSVRPLGASKDEPSEVMQVLVKLTRPGGHDDNGDGGHSKLIMIIPQDILDGGIDKDNVADGVKISIGEADGVKISIGEADGTEPYPCAAAGDTCRLSWGGSYVFSEPLTQEQAEGKAPIIITITEAVIRDAGDAESPGVAVVFEVYDKVFNRSEDWSPEQRVVVAVDATRLIAPLLKETQNNVLDVDKLGDTDGTVQIIATDTSKFKVGDKVFIRIKGTPVEGPPIDWEPSAGVELKSVPSILETTAPNAVLRQLAKSQITLSYRLEKADGSADLKSKSQFIRAIGEVQRLAAPKVLDEDSGALDPTLPQIRLEFPFDKSFVEGMLLKPVMLGTTPGLKPYLPELPTRPITYNDIVAAKPLLYNIDGKHMAPVDGGTAEFYYQLLISSAVLATLDPFEATRAIRESIHSDILRVGEPRLELPQLEVAGVVDGVLPPDTAGTTATVIYKETVPGDEVLLSWLGSITGEYPDRIKLNEFTAGEEVPFTIPAAMIKGNEGGKVKASYKIERAAGGTSHAEPLEFGVGVALDLKEPKIKEAPNDSSLDPLAAQSALTAVINYDGMQVGDDITANWKGAPGTLPAGSHTTDPWPVTTVGPQEIPLAVSVIAFNLDKSSTLDYSVKRGTQDPKDSRTRTLAVLPIAQSHLPKPLIVQASEAGEGPELDVSQLTTNATLRANSYPHIALRQYVWLKAKGTLKGGGVYSKTFWQPPNSQTNATWINQGFYTHAFPLADLQSLEDGSDLELEFKAAFGGSQVESEAVTFALRTYSIRALDLKNPVIKEANGNTLNPFAAKDTLTAVIAAYSNMIGTQVSVTWAGTSGEGSVTVGPIDVTAQADKEIPLPNSVVPFNLGKTVKVTCTVTRNGTLLGSKEVTLTVQPIVDGDNKLPTPTIDGAPDEELDLTDLADDARTRIAMWPLIAVGQKFWLRYSGIDEDDNPYERLFYDGVTVEFGDLNGLLPLAPDEELRTLKGGSELKIEFKISYDGSTNENQAVTSPIRRYTIMATPKLCIDTTPLILDGTNVILTDPQGRWSRTADSTGAIERRAACGGTPPYTYESEDPTIASVDDRGVVRSTGNGETIISVKDSMNVAISFEVRTSNVYELAITAQTFPTCMDAAAGISAVGGTMIDNENAAEMIKIITALSHAYRPLQPPYASNVTESFYTGNLISDGYPKQYWEVIARSGLSTVHESYGPGFVYSAYWTHVNGSSGGGNWYKLRAIYLM
ncbi:hypothetical protein [Pseudomonas zeae]|uniref:BIG2 domain-containing protein n=1 Tax=Pseudomonas zeae TaxID=2745510 RepID=A0A9E6NKN0_9PSED|nr:hypothetical protein [Pseudomonas zeae]QXI09374.1 hypothetical protein HU754_016090 [Pseudomonas zeae]